MDYKYNRINKKELSITFTEQELRQLIYIMNYAYTKSHTKYFEKIQNKLIHIRKDLGVD